ncbi:MAG: hypothetical protein SWZ49_31545 [Cyanobacteriota bacterium]|nr:hypothetical protein [Cyanobacteriota bacterium]
MISPRSRLNANLRAFYAKDYKVLSKLNHTSNVENSIFQAIALQSFQHFANSKIRKAENTPI